MASPALEVTVETEAGALTLEFAKAPTLVRATTSLGAVDLRLPGTTAYDVKASSEVGERSVTVDQDPTCGHRIEVRTEVGTVKVTPLPLAGARCRVLAPVDGKR